MLLLAGLLACVDPLAVRLDHGTSTPRRGHCDGEHRPAHPSAPARRQRGHAINQTTAAGVPEPLLARAAYLSIFAHRDPRCPGGQGAISQGASRVPRGAGWLFAGLAEYTGPPEPAVIDDFHLLGDWRAGRR